MKNLKKKICSFRFIGKTRRRLRLKTYSKRKIIFENIKLKSSNLKGEIKLSALLLKEYFNELTDVRYTKETTAALTQGLFTFGSAVQVERQVENQNSKILFTSDKLNKFNELNIFNSIVKMETLESLYTFLLENPDINFNGDQNFFKKLLEISIDCTENKIQTRSELEKILSIRAGADPYSTTVLILVIIMWLKQGSGFVLPPGGIRINAFGAHGGQNQNQNQNIAGGSSCLEANVNNNSEASNNRHHQKDRYDGQLHDGRLIFVKFSHARKKGYHMPAFLEDKDINRLGGNAEEIRAWERGESPDRSLRLDNPEQRQEFYRKRYKYFMNPERVPERLVRRFAQSLIDTGYHPEARIEEGIMGPNKTPGSVIFIENDQKVIFRDESAEIRSGVILSGDEERGQWSKFLESGRETGVYVLFPGNKL